METPKDIKYFDIPMIFNYSDKGHKMICGLNDIGENPERSNAIFGSEVIHLIIMKHWSETKYWFLLLIEIPFFLGFGVFSYWIQYVLTTIAAGLPEKGSKNYLFQIAEYERTKTFSNPACCYSILVYSIYAMIL